MSRARYEERPVGVWDRTNLALVLPGSPAWAEYQAYIAETGLEPDSAPPPPPASIQQVRAEKIAAVENLAGEVRRVVVGRATAPEMASWSTKAEQAQAYLKSGNPLDAPLLVSESASRGTTLDAIVARVVNNATLFEQAEALIAGVCGKHKDAIALLTTAAEIQAYDIEAGWAPLWP